MLARFSVRVLIPALVVLPVVGVAISLGWIGVSASRRSADDLASRIVTQIGERVSQRVEQQLGIAVTASDATRVLVDAQTLDPGALRDWSWLLWRQWSAFPGLSGIAFGRPDGSAVWIAKYPGDAAPEFAIKDADTGGFVEQYDMLADGSMPPHAARRVEYDLFTRPWYLTGAEGADGNFPGSRQHPAWSSIYSWSRPDGTGDTLGISYARPVYGAGNAFIGVLDTEIELLGLSDFLASMRIADRGLAVLIEPDGRVVATSRPQSLLDTDEARRLVWATTDDATRTVGAAVKARIESGESAGLVRVELGEEHWYTDLLPVRMPSGDGPRWSLLVAVPEGDLLAGVRQTQERARHAGLIAAGMAVLIGMCGAVWIARPILRLRGHLRGVAGGDLDTQVALGSAREFADLGRAINAMQAGLKDRMRLQKSLELAMDVQQALLPKAPPSVPGLDVAGYSAYCDETGGDYYDYLAVDSITPHGLAVVLGDVMGHGIASALLMATARGVVRSRAGEVGSLAELLNHTNAALVNDSGGYRFMTMLLVMIDPGAGVLRWSSAGQGPPLIFDTETSKWIDLHGGGMPLGIEASERYTEASEPIIKPGTVILLSSDGLWEAANHAKEQFGLDRVRAVVEAHASQPAEAIIRALRTALDTHCGELRPADDVTMVVVRAL
jgi:phosphoserine phosphatase RsbU/P